MWDYEKIKKYKGKIAVYVFWDEKGYSQGKDRYLYDVDHHPLYIGMTFNLGKRIVEHLTVDKFTKHYSIYFYGVDVYEFEDLNETESIIKSMRNDLFNYKTLAYLYEVYFTMRRLPWFNDTNNIYWARTPMILKYFKDGFYETRRSDWSKRIAGVNEGFKKIEGLAKEWKTLEKTI